jgi:hypothetical protein
MIAYFYDDRLGEGPIPPAVKNLLNKRVKTV